MSLWEALWVEVYQASVVDEWLLEGGDRWLLEDMSGYWLMES